ncbi:hypothetical protein [Breznakia pachnodae]|uniref:Uncharacterized protein n=1 Tax=Breznakia pachnodae TaxID=265178 RepID=A0ABU0DZC8_9FIRM|nr:hypothetical protein [Breznakia pachnodae]MDQ0359998.1 hypothetical protein [Breznakia pachnodae]
MKMKESEVLHDVVIDENELLYGVFINNELVNEGTEQQTNDYVTNKMKEINEIYGDNRVTVFVPEKEEPQDFENDMKVFLVHVELEKPLFIEILVIPSRV